MSEDDLLAEITALRATVAEREAERDEARKGVEQTMELLFDTRARLATARVTRDQLRADLLKANRAIERAKAMGATAGPLYTHALNQALKGERP